MKTTLDIHDDLLTRAKRHAQETRRPLRAVVEEGLRLVLSKETCPERYVLPDRSYGGPEIHDPLASYTWPELRDIIYGDGPRECRQNSLVHNTRARIWQIARKESPRLA